MFTALNFRIRAHIKENFTYYIVVLSLFIFGIILGAVSLNYAPADTKNSLINYFENFAKNSATNGISSFEVFKVAIIGHLKAVSIYWIFGMTFLGAFVVVFLICYKGFVTGFTASLIIGKYGLWGALFSLVAILPQIVFAIPLYVYITIITIKFSLNFFKSTSNRSWASKNIRYEIIMYTFKEMTVLLLLLIPSLIDGYFVTALLKSLLVYFSSH